MRDLAITLIVFGSLPLILSRPHVGILMYCWISYMNPHRLAWGFAYGMPFAALLGGTTLLAMLFSKDRRGIPMKPLTVVWLMWIVWMCVTTVFAVEPQSASWEWDRSMKIQLMALVTISLLQSRDRIIMLVWVLAVSIGFYSVKGGIFAVATGGAYRVWGPPQTFFTGTNPLALTMLMVLPLMIFLFIHTRHRLIRTGLGASMLLTVLATLSTYSRGAFLAAMAVAFYLVMQSRKKLLFLPLMGVLAAGALAFMPEKYYERIESIRHFDQEESAMGRLNAWTVAFRVAQDNPLVGGGFQMMSPALFARYLPEEKPHDVHSIYFEALGEQGFVGLGLFLLLMWLAMREGSRIKRLTKANEDLRWAYDLASAVKVSIVAYATGGAFLGLAYFDLYYHLIAILMLTGIVVDRQLQPEGAPAGSVRAPRRPTVPAVRSPAAVRWRRPTPRHSP